MNFKNGTPAPELLPVDAVRAATDAVLRSPSALQYGRAVGDPAFRTDLAAFVGSGVHPDALVVCHGATGGLDMALSLIADKGDTVAVENPTYFLALPVFRQHGLGVLGVDIKGMQRQLEQLRREASALPKALYVVPTHSNPRGATMPLETRLRLLGLAKEFGFVIVADEVYHHLTFDAASPPIPPFACLDPDGNHVVSIMSFSKLVGPALRLGCVFTGNPDSDLCRRFKAYGPLRSGGGLSTLSARIVHEMLVNGTLQRHVEFVRASLKVRAGALCGALLEAGVTVTRPAGGYFVWVDVADNKAKTRCAAAGIDVLWGDECIDADTHRPARGCRLSFSFLPIKDLVKGAAVLAKVLIES